MNENASPSVLPARPSLQRLASTLPYLIIGVFLLLFLLSAVLGPDMLFYLQWAQVFRHLNTETFLFFGHTLSPLGVPLTQWSHGPGLLFSLCPAACGSLSPEDPQVQWIGWGFAVIFWLAMFRLLRRAGIGDVQWAVYGVLIAIFGTHMGFYSRSLGSEALSQTFLVLLAVWVLSRERWGILDALVAGCLAAFLVIIRWQLLLYAIPLFGAMYYGMWQARTAQSPWRTSVLAALPLVPVLLGLVQVGFTNRWMTGDFLRSPYSFGNETFKSLDFARPELATVLLHPWHGLLSYHPLYLLGFVALLLLVLQSRSWATRLFYIGFVLVIVAHVYLQAAWYAWWLGTATFGMRGLSVSAVVLVPAIVRYMREREYRNKPNMLFGLLVLAACLWSLPLLLAALRSDTQFMTYSELLRSYATWIRPVLLALAVLGFTLVCVFLMLRRARRPLLEHLRETLTGQLHRRPILSLSLLILFPVGFYGLAQYILTRRIVNPALGTGLSAGLAVVTIPLGALLILLFLSISASSQPGTSFPERLSANNERNSKADRPGKRAVERLAAVVTIGVFVLGSVVFARLARHVEGQIATGSAPTDQISYVSAVRVDEVESSYCEYLNVPGFDEKKAALRGFLEELKACAKVQPAALGLPQCTGPSTTDRSVAASFAPFVGINRVSIAGGSAPNGEPVFQAGDRAGITTYWEVLQDTQPMKFSLRLQDSEARQWASVDYWPDVGCSSSESWKRGETHVDRQGLTLPPDLPPGPYEIALAVYDPQTGIAVPVGAEPTALLTTLDVLAAATPPEPDTLGIPKRLDLRMSDDLALLGYGIQPEPLRHESESWLSVWWTALRRPTLPYQVQTELLDDAGQVVFTSISPLSGAPTDTWQDGQIVAERYPIALDPAVSSGDYRLRLSLLGPDGTAMGQTVELGSVAVLARPHMFELPAVEHPLNTEVGEEIALRGYTIDRPAIADKELRLTLYWQALKQVDGRYRVFVHVVDESGRIVAQMDEEPAAGAAATQTWLRGEVISDTHVLSVPSGGPYQLLTGLYDSETGQRLVAVDETRRPIPGAAIPLERIVVP